MTKKRLRIPLFPFLFSIFFLLFSTVCPQGSLSLDPDLIDPIIDPLVTLTTSNGQTTLTLETQTHTLEPDTDFYVTLSVQPGQEIAGVQCDFTYNPSLITVIDIIEGDLFTGYTTYFTPGENHPSSGTVTGIAGVVTTPGGHINHTGIFATLHLKTLANQGLSPLNLINVLVGGPTAESLPVTIHNTSITVTTGTATATMISITPYTQKIAPQETHTVTIMVSPTTEISGVQAALMFDPAFIQIINVTPGTLFGSAHYYSLTGIDNINGTIDGIFSVTTLPEGSITPGTLADITFTSLQKEGVTSLSLRNVIVGDSAGDPVPCSIQNGTVTIEAGADGNHSQVTVSPVHQTVEAGDTFTVDIYIDPTEHVAGAQFDLTFNPSLVTAQDVVSGDFFLGAESYFHKGTIDNTDGVIRGVAGAVLGPSSGIINPGVLATVTFTARSTGGQSSLGLTNVLMADPDAQSLSFTITNGDITILSGSPSPSNVTSIMISPEDMLVPPGETFTLDILVTPQVAISGVETDITFNPALLTAVAVQEGDLFGGFDSYFNNGTIDNIHGTIQGIWGVITEVGGGSTTSPGNFAQITFTAKMTPGSTPLSISQAIIGTPGGTPVQITIHHGTVTIGSSSTRTFSFSLKTGWNTLSLPLQGMFTAETLGETITTSDAIAKWDPTNQEYLIHPVGISGQDFSIQPGWGYFIHVYDDTQSSVTGIPIDTITIPLKTGWNLVGWAQGASTTAEQFGATITGCDVVAKWDRTTIQEYVIHPMTTLIDNFAINEGDALFIHTIQDSTWYGK